MEKGMIKKDNLKKFGVYNIILLLFFLSEGVFEISLPIYLLSLGHSFSEIGVMVATFSIGIIIFRLFVSMHSDKVGRKIYVIASLIGSACVCFILPFGNTMLYFIIILITRGACRGAFLAVRAPLIKDLCEESERGKMLGLASAFSTVGSALGGMLSGWLYIENNLEKLFFAIGLVYLFAGIFSLLFLPQKTMSMAIESKKITLQEKYLCKIKSIPYNIKVLCGVNMIQNIVTPPLWSMILPVYFTSVIGMSVKSMGLVFSMDNVLGVPSSIVGGIWADKNNFRDKSMILNIICAFIAIILSMQKSPIFFTIFILVFMTIFSINSPVLEKIESISARDSETGFDLGLISASVALGGSIGSIIFGVIIDTYGFSFAYVVIGIGYLLMSLLISRIKIIY